MSNDQEALFRHRVINQLLGRHFERGELSSALYELSQQRWINHRERTITVSLSTVTRWYYAAKKSHSKTEALKRKVREPLNQALAVTPQMATVLQELRRKNPNWSTRLLYDNFAVLFSKRPSYSTVLRFVKANSLEKQKLGPKHQPRSWAARRPNEIWHFDFHHLSREIRLIDSAGKYVKAYLVAFFDNYSRYCLHAQWYYSESAESLVHALSQALLKHRLPRVVYTDNGSAMISGEVKQGLLRLGIELKHTQVKSPYMNGACERPWQRFDNRLIEMLKTEPQMDLQTLNKITAVWVHEDYNHKPHRGLEGALPIAKYNHSDRYVSEVSFDTDTLVKYFTAKLTRCVRSTDGTVVIDGIRYEIPSQHSRMKELELCRASWNRQFMFITNPKTRLPEVKIYPVDRVANASKPRVEKQFLPETYVFKAPLLESYKKKYDELHKLPTFSPSPELERKD